jgi:hypothetical protein
METGEGRRRWGAAIFGGEEERRRGYSTVPEADDTAKSDVAAREAKGGDWSLEVEDDQRKLGWWVECAVGPNC